MRMTSLTDKMEKLRKSLYTRDMPSTAEKKAHNACLDQCQALAEAEVAVVGDWEQNHDLFASSIGLDGDQIDDIRTFTRTLLAAKDREYQELLFAVESKYEGETRHQTALRLILTAQKPSLEAETYKKDFIDGESDKQL